MNRLKTALVTLAVAAAISGAAAAPALADSSHPVPGAGLTTLDRHRPVAQQ
ncbi:hypothetical protein [Streptomyces kronopolitis]|uniref:hypothetical protein n=1 Tax=Streptomyces kronopolitis TaxID=1612435 RepID=UPI0020BE461C|nr:hypothetical protein [Streptomyces kronopolitis]MCL6296808.1 hypothetical protein [Streptomyces kronopolitis]